MIHTCSYHCSRPECIKAQRDDLVEKLNARSELVVQMLDYMNAYMGSDFRESREIKHFVHTAGLNIKDFE